MTGTHVGRRCQAPGNLWAVGAGSIAAVLLAGSVATGPAALAALAAPATGTPSSSPIVTTFAGGAGGPGVATTISIGAPCGVTSSGQSLLVGTTDGQGSGVVRTISVRSGRLRNLAGANFLNGFVPRAQQSPNGIPASGAQFVRSCDVAADHHGNLVVADSAWLDPGVTRHLGTELIRVVPASTNTFYGQPMIRGHIYTIAGNGSLGDTGDGGPATQARIGIPAGVAVDANGNVVFATTDPSGRIRVVAASTGTFYGQSMTAGDIYTVAGGGTTDACATGAPDGQPATSIQLGITVSKPLSGHRQVPSGLRVDQSGNLVVAEAACGGRVQVVAARSGSFYGRSMTSGHIYTIAGGGTASPGDGGLATNAELGNPGGIALDHAGNLVIAESSTHSIRVVAVKSGSFYGQRMVKGHIYPLAGGHGAGFGGDGGPASAARLDFPSAVAVDGQGNLAIADTGNNKVRLVADKNGTFYGRAMRAGDIYTIVGNGLAGFSGDQGPAVDATLGYLPAFGHLGIATDPAGDTLILDPANARVRLVAGQTHAIFGKKVVAEHIYTLLKIAKTRLAPSVTCEETLVPPGSPLPCYAAFDPAGNAVLATHSTIEILAARTGTFYREHMVAGHLYVVAGGGTSTASGALARSAKLRPVGLAVDGHGNLVTEGRVVAEATGTFFGIPMVAGRVYQRAANQFVAAVDSHGNAIVISSEKVKAVAGSDGTFYGEHMVAGHKYVLAGNGFDEYSGDGGPAKDAGMLPASAGVDAAGNLVIADLAPGDHAQSTRVRIVAESNGTFYGQAMTAGDIYTIAGGGTEVTSGILGLDANLGLSSEIAIAPGNAILIADNFEAEVRRIG